MAKTEKQWMVKGHEIKKKQPPEAFGVNLKLLEEKWDERQMAGRLEHGCYGGPCSECDKRFGT